MKKKRVVISQRACGFVVYGHHSLKSNAVKHKGEIMTTIEGLENQIIEQNIFIQNILLEMKSIYDAHSELKDRALQLKKQFSIFLREVEHERN